MDPRFQTSFIPKKPIVTSPGRASSTVNLFSLLATVIFIVSLALAGGIFFYQGIVKQQIVADKDSFTRAQAAFEPDTINKIVRLDSRLSIAKKLLASHISVTPFFNFLSSVTLKSVRFTDFSFAYNAQNKIEVDMKGEGLTYAAVALESDLLSEQKLLKNTVLSNMALESTGNISFSVTALIDPNLVSYPNELNGSVAPAINVQTVQTSAQPATSTASSTKTK